MKSSVLFELIAMIIVRRFVTVYDCQRSQPEPWQSSRVSTDIFIYALTQTGTLHLHKHTCRTCMPPCMGRDVHSPGTEVARAYAQCAPWHAHAHCFTSGSAIKSPHEALATSLTNPGYNSYHKNILWSLRYGGTTLYVEKSARATAYIIRFTPDRRPGWV